MVKRALGLNDGASALDRSIPVISLPASDRRTLRNVKADIVLFHSVQAAIESYPYDAKRAAIIACCANASGAVQRTALLQAGSLRDVAFYERQVVELCFRYELNLVVLVFCFPAGQISCPAHLMVRFNRFAQTLRFIEMSMPFVVWKAGDHARLLAMRSHERPAMCDRGGLE